MTQERVALAQIPGRIRELVDGGEWTGTARPAQAAADA
jgi:hypothetical protein